MNRVLSIVFFSCRVARLINCTEHIEWVCTNRFEDVWQTMHGVTRWWVSLSTNGLQETRLEDWDFGVRLLLIVSFKDVGIESCSSQTRIGLSLTDRLRIPLEPSHWPFHLLGRYKLLGWFRSRFCHNWLVRLFRVMLGCFDVMLYNFKALGWLSFLHAERGKTCRCLPCRNIYFAISHLNHTRWRYVLKRNFWFQKVELRNRHVDVDTLFLLLKLRRAFWPPLLVER